MSGQVGVQDGAEGQAVVPAAAEVCDVDVLETEFIKYQPGCLAAVSGSSSAASRPRTVLRALHTASGRRLRASSGSGSGSGPGPSLTLDPGVNTLRQYLFLSHVI